MRKKKWALWGAGAVLALLIGSYFSLDIYKLYFRVTHENPVAWENIEIKYNWNLYYKTDHGKISFMYLGKDKKGMVFFFKPSEEHFTDVVTKITTFPEYKFIGKSDGHFKDHDAIVYKAILIKNGYEYILKYIPDYRFYIGYIGDESSYDYFSKFIENVKVLQ